MPTIAPAVNLDDNHQVGITSTFWTDGSTATGGSGQAVLGVPCQAPVETFHIHSHVITENGTVSQFTGDPATVTLHSHRHIALVLGTPITQVPFFTWTAN